MKVLSLFDGMACGALALHRAGIEIDRYVAYEIDKYAVKTSSHNFPFIEHKGDVFKGDFTEYKGFDLLCGGSPCTYWSIAQKNNRETEASGIGWEQYLGTIDKPVYKVENGQITIKGKQYPTKLVDGYYIIRKLTVRECMRLQTVPEWYEFPVSNSQAYKMLGNGWTVEVIAHILESIKRC